MSSKKDTKTYTRGQKIFWISILLVLMAGVASLLVAIFTITSPPTRLSEIRDEVKGIESLLQQYRAVEDLGRRGEADKAPHECLDQGCPNMIRGWFIAIDHTKAREILVEVAEVRGFKVRKDENFADACKDVLRELCFVVAEKGDLRLQFNLGGGNSSVPDENVEPNKWLYLQAYIEQLKGKQ